jgi:choline dehydrogenase-like flavoprotein
VLAALQDGKPPKHLKAQIKHILAGMDYLAASGFWAFLREIPGLHRSVWNFFPLEKRRFSQFEVLACLEQSPDPSNRVVLGQDCDRFGNQLAELRWHLNEYDRTTLNQLKKIWYKEILCAGISGSVPEEDVEGMGLKQPGFHHMGTTRMHLNPKQGVVDAHCQVHGVTNLYVVGSSVFPTAGSANPTLTILALAIRLADHIKLQMCQPNPVSLVNQPVDHEVKSL